jgi:predicted phage tail protein
MIARRSLFFVLTTFLFSQVLQTPSFAVDTPSNVSVVGNRGGSYTAGTATVKWSTVTGAEMYSVQTLLSGTQIGDLTSILGQSSGELTITGLQGGSEYAFRVRAVVSGAVSPWSAQVTATAITSPVAPSKPTHSNENLTVTVRWVAPVSNGGSSITSYVITEANSGSTTSASPTSTSAVFTNLTAGANIKFNVKAINDIGSTGSTSVNSDQTKLPNVPAQVASVGATATTNKDELSVNWEIPADQGSAITGFTVFLRQSDKDIREINVSDATSTKLLIQNLAAGQYTIQVLAKNAIGSGSRSPESKQITVEGVTPASTATAAPSSGGGSSGGGSSGGGSSGGGSSGGATSSPSPTPTPTNSASPTPTPSKSPTATPTPSKKVTPTPSKKVTPTPSKKVTPTPSKKVTPTPSKS